MTKRFKMKISRILSFKSCRSKDPSDLPFDPVRRNSAPVDTPSATAVPQRRRSSFRLNVFGCGSSRRRRTSTPSLTPPHTPTFELESEGKCHVIAKVNEVTPRRKIYAGRPEKNDPRRSGKYVRRRGSVSSAEEYEEDETERESLLPSSANPSPEHSSSEVQRRRRGKTSVGVVEGVAVVKRSEDPYEDFKGSMMEMIVEKKMVQVAELEQLLRCFLTLNAKRHHRAIVKAFSEVWVALFSGDSRRSSVRLSDYDDS